MAPMQRHSSRHRVTALVAVWLLALAVLLTPRASAQTPHVRVLEIDGPITPVMATYVDRGLRDAERSGAAAVVLRMDTPGGLSSAMDDITADIFSSPVPVIVYVAPSGARAGSAGVYITYAAHIAAMAPSTNIGSATPVFLDESGQAQQADDAMTKKVVNDAVAKIRGFAEARGRNADWAERAVREAENITAQQALELNVIDLIAPDLPTLLEAVDGRTVETAAGTVTLQTRGAEVRTTGMGLGEQFFQLISDPSIAYILLSLGMLGLFLELANPGSILPGVIGGIFVLLALFSLGTLDVNWAGVLLMGFGFLLFIIDVYVPSHGVLTIGGVIAFALGSIMLMNSTAGTAMQISKLVVATVTILVSAFFLFIVGSVARAQMRRPTTGREGLVGAIGTVREALAPHGYVFVEGELWRASSPAGPLEPGTAVRVIGIEGLELTVMPAEAEQALPSQQSA
ncbi:MAG: nodulation protein NfeD [Sphaerobacter sp.]|nr:nodulation protein NfeD [Sphaerobacter sp.]